MSQPGYPTHPLSVPLHYKSVVLLQDLPSPASNLGPCRWFRHCSGLLVSVLSLRHHCDCSVATDRLVSHWCSGWGACQRKATTGRIYHQHWATIQYSPSLSVSMSGVSMQTERSTLFSGVHVYSGVVDIIIRRVVCIKEMLSYVNNSEKLSPSQATSAECCFIIRMSTDGESYVKIRYPSQSSQSYWRFNEF